MPYKDEGRRLESEIKADWIKYTERWYPTSHPHIIPASSYRLLPYDAYVLYKGIFRAVEFKIDDHPVMAHQYYNLFKVVENGGFAFVVRWINAQKAFVVDNFTLGTAEKFTSDPSDRQRTGNSKLSLEDKPATKESAFRKCIDYIMGFSVSPLESEIQDIIKRNWDTILKAKLGKVKA